MAKIRVVVFLLTLIVVGLVGLIASYYARGYRFDFNTLKFQPNGILVIQSEPVGASVYVNGELKTATNASISLSPGVYDVTVKKDGYFNWYKRLTIDKEIVTSVDISLFKTVPSLSPVTFDGASNPIISPDGTKIVYAVLPSTGLTQDKGGLWSLDTFSLPLGFSNEPKRITDGDLTGASYIFSPDDRQIMLTTSNGIFVLDSGSFTPQDQRVNVASQQNQTLSVWQSQKTVKDQSLIKNLPSALIDILTRRTSDFVFSPDQNMILYTASSSATLSDGLIPPLPGSSTQKQARNLEPNHTYVYDIKEDRNFLIDDQKVNLTSEDTSINSTVPAIRWMPTSRHLMFAGSGQIIVMDYDGTNREVVYAGAFLASYAFPFNNTTRLLILTNLGGATSTPNLYALTIK